ncbi:hypothetical protein V4R08_12210 [Nitrobacter sp. NHB1]|uniref:hypothetical protein n=1 Tax=Nitrobacter sp. NHB1 TaxID=3119830 RepID=UPI002FFD8270
MNIRVAVLAVSMLTMMPAMAPAGASAATENSRVRVALVIGNASYPDSAAALSRKLTGTPPMPGNGPLTS